MGELLMEKHEVPALYLANKSVMALYGGGQMTGGLASFYSSKGCPKILQPTSAFMILLSRRTRNTGHVYTYTSIPLYYLYN